jgi:hypothetical protein
MKRIDFVRKGQIMNTKEHSYYVWGVGHKICPLHHDLQWSIVVNILIKLVAHFINKLFPEMYKSRKYQDD